MKEPASITLAAQSLGLTRRTIQRWIREGLLTKREGKVCLFSAREIAKHYRIFPRRGPRLGAKPTRREVSQRAAIATYRDYHRANRIAKAIDKLGPDGLVIVASALKEAFDQKMPSDPLASISTL
jgi:hypothetical protein